jgi:hypothetical protein
MPHSAVFGQVKAYDILTPRRMPHMGDLLSHLSLGLLTQVVFDYFPYLRPILERALSMHAIALRA